MSKTIKAAELIPDASNANKGTQRGRAALEASLRQYGAGRSILVDKHGRIIAGNKTLETAVDIGLEDVVVVQTDGKQIVAVQRMDLDLAQDESARMLAYADNRVGELDLDFDADQLLADLNAGLPLEQLWFENELDALLEADALTNIGDAPESNERKLGDKNKQIKVVLYADELKDFERAILATGQKNRGIAILEICRHYLDTHEKGQQHTQFESLFADEAFARD